MILKVKFLAFLGFALLTISISFPVLSQRELFLNTNLHFAGLSNGNEFLQGGNVLQRGWNDPQGNALGNFRFIPSIGLHYRYSKTSAVELGVRTSNMLIEFHDQSFMQNHGIKGSDLVANDNHTEANSGNFLMTNRYHSIYLSYYYFIPIQSGISFYINPGVALNYLAGQKNIEASYLYSSTNEALKLSAQYKSFYLGSFIEGGVAYRMPALNGQGGKGPLCFFGVRYNCACNVATSKYQNIQNGMVAYSDYATSCDNYFSMTFKIAIGLLKAPGLSIPKNDFVSHRHVHHHAHKPHHFGKPRAHKKVIKQKQNIPIPKLDHSNTRGF